MKEKGYKVLVEKTADGSNTLFIPEMDEHYHSVKGALTESRHIFIDMGLKHIPRENYNVFEVGFGTGLNAFLTYLTANELKLSIHYTTIELCPLKKETIQSLAYPSLIASDKVEDFYHLHESSWEDDNYINDSFVLKKLKADYTQYKFPTDCYHVIYFDAFAPEKQPEMWTQQLFDKLYLSLKADGVLVTYCAKGIVRRMLQFAGFKVERLSGPPGGKREILRALKYQ